MSLVCHIVHTILSIIPEIVWAKSKVLSISKYQQRTVLFTNKRKYKSREHGTSSGMNFGNGARKHLRFSVHFSCVLFLKTKEYDQVNTRSNVVADPIYRFHLMLMRYMPWTRTYSMILIFSWLQTWCFILGVNSVNSLTPGRYDSNFNISISHSLCRIVAWALAVKLLSDECQTTSLMRSQHWFR